MFKYLWKHSRICMLVYAIFFLSDKSNMNKWIKSGSLGSRNRMKTKSPCEHLNKYGKQYHLFIWSDHLHDENICS